MKLPSFLQKAFSTNTQTVFSEYRGYASQSDELEDYNIAWNYIAMDSIAEVMSNIPYEYQNKAGDIQENKKILSVINQPNVYQSWDDFVYLIGMYYMGVEGFAPVVLDNATNPLEMMVLPPSSIYNSTSSDYQVSYKVNNVQKIDTIPEDRMVIIKKPSLTAIDEAMGTTSYIKDNVKVEKRGAELITSAFLNKGRLGTILTTDQTLLDPKKKEIITAIDSKNRGTKNAFRTLLFDSGIKATESTVNNKDLQINDLFLQNRDQILSAYKVPKIILGLEDASSMATAFIAERAFYKNAVNPINNKFYKILSTDIATRYSDYKEGDLIVPEDSVQLDPELKANIEKTNAETSQIQINSGVKLVNEVRDDLGLKPLKEVKEIVKQPAKEEKKLKSVKEKDIVVNNYIAEEKKTIKQDSINTEEKNELDYHKKKLFFSDSLEIEAQTKLKTFFRKAEKLDKSLNSYDEETLLNDYVTIMTPILIKAMENQGILLRNSRGLVEEIKPETISKLSLEQAEKSGTSVVATIKKETTPKDELEKKEYYDNRDSKIEAIAVNEIHTAIGIATLKVFEKNAVPYKKWRTFGDERVCQFCRPMDGVIIKTGDKFWNANDTMIGLDGGSLSFDYSPIGYSQLHAKCRCTLVDVYVKPANKSNYKLENKMFGINGKLEDVVGITKKIDKSIINKEKADNKKEKENQENIIEVLNKL